MKLFAKIVNGWFSRKLHIRSLTGLWICVCNAQVKWEWLCAKYLVKTLKNNPFSANPTKWSRQEIWQEISSLRKGQTIFSSALRLGNFINYDKYFSIKWNVEDQKWKLTLLPMNWLSVFDHFVGLTLKGLNTTERLES